MKDYREFFRNKKITVLGLGLLGRGVGDIEFLAKQGAILTVTDLKSEEELLPSLEKLKSYDITFHLGGHKIEDFQNCDFVLKSAGVPLNSPFLEEARKNNIPIEMSASLFSKFSPAKIVGVTGTRGKSTVAAMIFDVLKKNSKNAFLGGNVKGISTLAHLPESTTDEIAVLELDSWQLQGFGEDKISPHIAVFTNLKEDHLNYYPNQESYFNDKANIFKFQKKDDVLIAGRQVTDTWIKNSNPPIEPIIPDQIPNDWNLKVIGEHNRENASFAAEVLRQLGVEEEKIKEGLESFEPVEGRLQFVKEVEGVKIYNDNNSTTPDATVAALASLSEFKEKIILIFGGADKGLNPKPLLETLPKFCKAVVTLPGTGTEKLKVESEKLKVFKTNSLKEALEESVKVAEEGDVILFSPGFASFGPPPGGFKNEYDRGERFLKIVSSL